MAKELFGKVLRCWRLKHKLFLKEACEILDVPKGSYYKYEYDQRQPNPLAKCELNRRMADYDASHPLPQ